MNTFSRRRFLRTGVQAITGAGLALSGNPFRDITYADETSANLGEGYRALVCIYLEGGCDGFSLLAPTGSYESEAFAQSRGHLAVSQNDLLNLGGNASEIGLHSSAAALQPFFDDGRAAMIANVGTLIQPTSAEQYQNNLVALPAQLFSHSDQTIQWQQLQGRGSATDGWGARTADFLQPYQDNDYLTSVSLAGTNYWQTSTSRRPFSLTAQGPLNHSGLDKTSRWQLPRADAFERVLDLSREHLMEKAYADLQKSAISATSELGQALELNAGMFNDTPIGNPLAAQLAMVAQLIAAKDTLGLRRQIFYVTMKGFDLHDNQSKLQPELFAQLAEAMSYFQNKMDNLGQGNNVTTFTASDFGRSLLSNGDGTDHGWGNHQIVMGNATQGGRIYGQLPLLDVNGPDSVHNGRILPTLSASQYASTLLEWLGLNQSQVTQVLPTLQNFGTRNLNFLSA